MNGRCYICGEDNPNVLQTHHIFPRRLGGEDSPGNLVRLCANCHQAVESIYDDAFFDRVFTQATEWSEASSVREAVEAYVEAEIGTTEGGRIQIPPRGDSERGELYQNYVEYCEARRLPVHTSRERFYDTLEELAPEGTVLIR